MTRQNGTKISMIMMTARQLGTQNIQFSSKFKVHLNDKTPQSIRELVGNELVYTMTVDGVADLLCVQKFKRV